MTTNSLVVTIEATHDSLAQRLSEVERALGGDLGPREPYVRLDALTAATSRHLGAAEEVLVPEALRLPEGSLFAEDYLAQAHRLEESLSVLKARAYGERHATHLTFEEVWEDTRGCLERHNAAELRMVGALATGLAADRAEDLATTVYRAEVRAPTRAHPFIPHTGLVGRMARRVFARADRFWDVAQNRGAPPPTRPGARAASTRA